MKIIWGRIPQTPYKARAFRTRDSAPPPPPPLLRQKNMRVEVFRPVNLQLKNARKTYQLSFTGFLTIPFYLPITFEAPTQKPTFDLI